MKDFNKEKNSNSNNGTNKSNNSNKSNKSDLKQFMTKNKDRAINKNYAFITKIFYNKEDYLKMLKDIKDKNENGNENEDNNEHIYFKNTLGFNPCCYIDKIFLPSSAIDLRNKNNNDLNENENNENNKEDEIDPINLNELFDKNKICFISKINVINNNTNKNDDLNNNSNNSKNNINDDDLNNQDPINLNDLTSKNYNYYIDKIRINSSCYEKDNKDNEKNEDDENMKYRNKNDEKTDEEPININDFFSKNLPCYLTKIRKINPNESNKNEIEEDNEVSPINLNNDLCDYKSKACYIDKIRKKLSYANKELSDISFNTNKTDENAAINLYHLTSKHKPCYIDKIRKIINKNGNENENENEKENNKDKSFNDLDIGKNENFIIDSVKKPLILTPDNNNCFMIKDNKVLDNNILPIKNENKLDNKDCYISKDRQKDSMNDLKKLQKIISNYLRNKNDKKSKEKNNNNYRKPYVNPLLITKDYINQEMNKQIKELFKTFQSKDDNNVENPNKNIFAIEKVPDVTLINNKEKEIPPEEENNNIQDLDNELITKFPLLFKNNICYLTKIRKELANGASYLSKYNEILQIPKINDNDIKDINYISKKRLKDNNKELKKLQKIIKDFLSKLNKEKIYKKPLFNKFYYYEEIDTSDDEKPNKNLKNNNNITTKKNNNDDPNDEDESTKIKTKNYKNDDDYEEDEIVRIPKNIKTCKSKIHRYKHNHLLKVVVVKNDKIVDEKIIKKKRKGSDNYSKSDFESERSKKPDDLSENPNNKKKKTASVSPIAKNEIDDEDPKQKVKNKNNKKENPDKVKPLLDFDSNDIDFNKRKLIKKWKLGYGNYFYMSKIRLGDKKFLEDDKNKNKDNNEIYKNLPGINVKDSYMDKIRVGNEVYMEYLDGIINGKDKNKNNNENNNDNDDKNNNNNDDNKRKLSNTEFLEDIYRKPINDKRKLSNTEFLEDIYKNKNNDNVNDYLIGICYISKTRYKNPKSNINETKNELLSLLNMNYNLPMNALCFITKERFINDINKNNVNNLKNQNNLKNDKNDNEVENKQNNDPNKNEENNDDNNDEIILNPRSYLFKNNDNNDPNNESEINNNLNDYITKIYKRLILQVYPFKQQKNDVHYITKEIKPPLNKENSDTNNNANEKKPKNYSFIPLTKFFINKNIQEYVYPKLFPKTNKNASTINTLTSQNSVNNNKKNNDTNNGFPNYYNTIKRVYDFYKGKQRNKDPKSKAIFNKIIPDIDKSPSLNNLLTTLTNDPSKSNNIINIPYDPINSKNKNNNSPTEDDYINELGEFTKFDKNITDTDFIKKNLKNNNILKKNNNLLSIIKYIDNEYNKLVNGKYCTNCGLELPECKCNIFKDTEQEDDDDYIIDLDEDEDLNVGKKINFFEYDSNRSKGLLIPKKPKVVDYYNKPTSQIIIHDSKGLEKFNKNLLANCKKTDTYNSKNNKKNVKDNGPSARRAKGNEDNNLKSSCGSINSNSNASNGSKGSRVYNSGYNNKYGRKK